MKTLLSIWSRVGEMHEASNGREVVQLVQQLLPDALLTDVRMHEQDGLQAAAQIKALWPQAKVILLSLCAAGQGLALAAGAGAFVGKGEAPDRLLDLVSSVIQQQV